MEEDDDVKRQPGNSLIICVGCGAQASLPASEIAQWTRDHAVKCTGPRKMGKSKWTR